MYPTIIYQRSFRFSAIWVQQHTPSTDLGRNTQIAHDTTHLPNPPNHPQSLMANQTMEPSHMQEILRELWESWSRSAAENEVVVIDSNLIPPVTNALIFRFVARKTIGIKGLEAALNAIWRPSSPANVYEIGEGIYIVRFESAMDCNRVLAKQPWHMDNTLMVFKKAIGNERIEDLVLNEVPFWVQIHNLELQLLIRYVGELLGSKIGKVLEFDSSTKTCLRVRVLLNVSKPLVRGTKIEFDGATSIVLFRYEELGDFCYVCGKLDHVDRNCPTVYASEIDSVREKRQYGPWLKADGQKGISLEELIKSIRKKT